jgi:E3 ubiquitin-protein ligase listerin
VLFYPKLAIDNSRRVRELAHQVQHDITASIKKRMEKYMPVITPSWLAGTLDRERAVLKAANDGLTFILNTDDKVQKCWKMFQPQILEYARNALNETPQSLCDDRSMSEDEIQETYLRVLGSSASLVEYLLSHLDKPDLLNYQDKYKLYFDNDPAKLWGLISCQDSFVRRVIAKLLVVCLKKLPDVVEANLELISKAFITDALSSSQTASALQLLQALGPLTSVYPQVWTSSYKAKKTALSKLQKFIAKGSQGGPAAYWQSLQSVIVQLPHAVLPTETQASLEFLTALRDGVNSREEHRGNAEQAWTSYFHIADFLVKYIPDEVSQGKFFQDALFPIFEHYLHPMIQNSKWSLGQNTAALAKALVICASTTNTALRTSLGQEWQRLADDFILRLRTSLPEQSKDYAVSQASVVAEGNRWFSLVGEVFRTIADVEVSQILEQHSSRIITAALAVITTRNGKAYSAASTLDAALRLTPQLFGSIENMNSLRTFFEQNLNCLLVSPSMEYLVSVLHAFGNLSEQKSDFAKLWESAVCSILQRSEEEEEQKLRAVTALIASHDVRSIGALNEDLQTFLYRMCAKALHGDQQAWPIFETAITFHTLAPAQAKMVVQLMISGLDVVNVDVDYAIRALELLAKKDNDLLQDDTTHRMLLTKFLVLSETSDKEPVASKAMKLRVLVEPHSEESDKVEVSRGRVIQLIRDELEVASPQSLL